MNDILLIAGAGLVAGTMNAIAGGGSFVTLPALMTAGVPALNANASSTVALVPSALASAYAYRHDFQDFEGVSFRVMALLSVAGGVCGRAAAAGDAAKRVRLPRALPAAVRHLGLRLRPAGRRLVCASAFTSRRA